MLIFARNVKQVSLKFRRTKEITPTKIDLEKRSTKVEKRIRTMRWSQQNFTLNFTKPKKQKIKTLSKYKKPTKCSPS